MLRSSVVIRLRRAADGNYVRGSYSIERARVDGRAAWRVRDVSGLGAVDFTVPTLGDVRRWFAWLEGNTT